MTVVIAACWISVKTLHKPSADELLAQAYTERRTIDIRIPGAKYAPLRVERSDATSNFDKPDSLLKAESLISEQLRSKPHDPDALEAKARAELLDGTYDDAIKTLQRALEFTPHSPQLLTDLGAAYFLRAKSTNNANASAGWQLNCRAALGNARAVRLFGTQLLSIRIDLDG